MIDGIPLHFFPSSASLLLIRADVRRKEIKEWVVSIKCLIMEAFILRPFL